MSLVRGFFLRDLPFPPPLHSGDTAYSPRFTLIGSQDLNVDNYPNIFTHELSGRYLSRRDSKSEETSGRGSSLAESSRANVQAKQSGTRESTWKTMRVPMDMAVRATSANDVMSRGVSISDWLRVALRTDLVCDRLLHTAGCSLVLDGLPAGEALIGGGCIDILLASDAILLELTHMRPGGSCADSLTTRTATPTAVISGRVLKLPAEGARNPGSSVMAPAPSSLFGPTSTSSKTIPLAGLPRIIQGGEAHRVTPNILRLDRWAALSRCAKPSSIEPPRLPTNKTVRHGARSRSVSNWHSTALQVPGITARRSSSCGGRESLLLSVAAPALASRIRRCRPGQSYTTRPRDVESSTYLPPAYLHYLPNPLPSAPPVPSTVSVRTKDKFIRHALDDSEPITDLQGNKQRVPYARCEVTLATLWGSSQ
ncbi:hypothetical protein PR048_020571 [Dryococelus australis]|uniref:Uncharacterized protein n=1 Tax=Dryococelus australis TaxID=614101 RepID=A0ABQ9H6M9_9NEOP|nr:hypothetical protein PR048_020571 [Dryococelus australis]